MKKIYKLLTVSCDLVGYRLLGFQGEELNSRDAHCAVCGGALFQAADWFVGGGSSLRLRK